MQFKFVGQGPKDHKTLEPFVAFGVTFPPGEWVEIDDDWLYCGKLTWHSHFVSRPSENLEDEADEELKQLRELAKEKGIDRVGVKGKEKLLAELEALNGNAS